MTYYSILILLLTSIIPPAFLVVFFSRVRTVRQIWRQSQIAVALGILLDVIRRLVTLFLFDQPEIPVGVAVFTVLTLGTISMGMWAQATRMIRHHYRNQDLARQGRLLREELSRAETQE